MVETKEIREITGWSQNTEQEAGEDVALRWTRGSLGIRRSPKDWTVMETRRFFLFSFKNLRQHDNGGVS